MQTDNTLTFVICLQGTSYESEVIIASILVQKSLGDEALRRAGYSLGFPLYESKYHSSNLEKVGELCDKFVYI